MGLPLFFGQSNPRYLERAKPGILHTFLAEGWFIKRRVGSVERFGPRVWPGPLRAGLEFRRSVTVAFWLRTRLNLHQAGIKRGSPADVSERF